MMQQWFAEAKLGIFIHWGIYAVNGISESWSFFNGQISYEDYMKQCEGFTAAKYDPKQWAKLFKAAGARYAVLTAKHHDGVALYDTKWNDLSTVHKTPAGRDLVAPYCKALREEDIHVGIYYSHLDWSHPDYASVRQEGGMPEQRAGNPYSYPQGKPDDEKAWERFLDFHRGQLKEIMTSFAPVELLWFDGDWERSERQWKMKELRDYLHSHNQNVVINSRIKGYGDYETPEQGMPIYPPEGPWEFCMTINDSWGYQHRDKNYKTARQIIRIFAECIGMGGNLLLDIGPMADGSIDPVQEERLLALGKWINQNEEAIYTTMAGLPAAHYYGASTISKDRKTIYLFQFDKPWDKIAVKGIRNPIKAVSILSSGQKLTHQKIGGASWMNLPGILWIDVPEQYLDPNATVIKIELEEALDLYSGKGSAISVN